MVGAAPAPDKLSRYRCSTCSKATCQHGPSAHAALAAFSFRLAARGTALVDTLPLQQPGRSASRALTMSPSRRFAAPYAFFTCEEAGARMH
eukprot:428777-Pleurochrysis_carterae.AAC.1